MENKRLYRIPEKGMICGVCAGLAEYFSIDVSLVRLGWILFTFAGGAGLFAYIISAIIIPVRIIKK